jgi:phospholipid transport system transporter-binding protein
LNALAAALSLPATLDHAGAAEFVKKLTAAIESSRSKADSATVVELVVDASALRAFDSSALAVLLECRRRAIAAGHAFSVSGASARLTQLATLYGVAELFPAHVSRSAGVAA